MFCAVPSSVNKEWNHDKTRTVHNPVSHDGLCETLLGVRSEYQLISQKFNISITVNNHAKNLNDDSNCTFTFFYIRDPRHCHRGSY